MSIFVSALYTLFLALVAEKLIEVEQTGGGTGAISVMSHVNKDNYGRIGAILAIFLVDWVIFGLVFQEPSLRSLGAAEVILLVGYLPALMCLAAACLYSLEDNHRFAAPLAGHHIFAILAEGAWVMLKLSPHQGASIALSSVMILFAALFVEFFLRLLVIIGLILASHQRPVVDSRVLLFVALTLKPAVFVVLQWDDALKILVS